MMGSDLVPVRAPFSPGSGAPAVLKWTDVHGSWLCIGGFGRENLGVFSKSCIFDGYEPSKKPGLKPLLDRVPPGFMVDTPWLRGQGIDPKSIHDYVARGWLKRVIPPGQASRPKLPAREETTGDGRDLRRT